MHEFAIVTNVVASVVGVVVGMITVRRRQLSWRLTSVEQFGGAIVAALVAVMFSTHSDGLDLAVMAAAVAWMGLSVYAWHVRTGLSQPR